MREESHLEDMRSAIRGDFERLAERRGEQELMRVVEEQPEPAAEAPPPDDEATEPAAEQPDAEPPPRRSWLSRFLSP